MKRTALALALTAVTALAGAGCSSDDGPKVVVYNAQHEQLLEELAPKFEKETGIKVELRNGSDSELAAQLVQEGKASPADVQRVAKTYLADDRRMTITYRPESERPKGEAPPAAPTPPKTVASYDGPVFTLAPEAERVKLPPLGDPVQPVLPKPAEKTLPNLREHLKMARALPNQTKVAQPK